jgi:hypothetical protein
VKTAVKMLETPSYIVTFEDFGGPEWVHNNPGKRQRMKNGNAIQVCFD